MTVNKAAKRALCAGTVLALLTTLLAFASVSADIVCTVSVALTMSDVRTTKIGHNHATICWSTDGKTTSQVFYDVASHANIADYASCTREYKPLVQEHKVALNKLSPSTTYYYRVRSAAQGIELISDEYTFTTLPFPGGGKAWWARVLSQVEVFLYSWWPW